MIVNLPKKFVTSHFWPDDPVNAQATRKTKRHIKG
jgi:hypothetical protein